MTTPVQNPDLLTLRVIILAFGLFAILTAVMVLFGLRPKGQMPTTLDIIEQNRLQHTTEP